MFLLCLNLLSSTLLVRLKVGFWVKEINEKAVSTPRDTEGLGSFIMK
jgi:hypothetical protein